MKKTNLLTMIDNISLEKKISKETIINSIKEGFIKSYEKQHPNSKLKVELNEKNGSLNIYVGYLVINDIDELNENSILLKDALLLNNNIKIGEFIYKKLNYETFERGLAIQIAQILRQQIREAEKKSIYNEYKDKINEIISGKVVTVKDHYCLLEVGRTFAFLPRKNMLFNDNFNIDDIVKFYVEDISEISKNSGQILASRTHNNFLKKILEQEIPEIFEGIVEIKNIAREPGIRSKISVYSENKNIDPVGTCVGIHGSRIKKIIEELNGENIDVCKWSEDLYEYIRNIFSIINILKIEKKEPNEINLVVSQKDLSLAIGKKGRTIKLCANLLSAKINVLSEDSNEAKEILEINKKQEEEIKLSVNNIEINELHKDNNNSIIKDKEILEQIKSSDLITNEIDKIKPVESITEEIKSVFQKYKNQFATLTEKISILNDKKYDNNEIAKEIRIKFINLFSYFNDYDQKNISMEIFNKIQNEINLKTLKQYCDFVNNDINNEAVQEQKEQIENSVLNNDVDPMDDKNLVLKNIIKNKNIKTDKIDDELKFYNEIENHEQELDDEYYDNIDYDEYDQYYD